MGRFDTDIEGKEIAHNFFKNWGFEVTATTDTFDHLDGAFISKDGEMIGVEVKNMGIDRYEHFNDILIATNKYEYSIGEGKVRSGLTETIKFDYTKVDDGIIVFVTRFSYADTTKKPISLYVPNEHTDNANYSWQQFYSIPRSKAKKYKITEKEIIRL